MFSEKNEKELNKKRTEGGEVFVYAKWMVGVKEEDPNVESV